MNTSSTSIRKIFFLAGFLLLHSAIIAQLDFKDPSYGKRDNQYFTLEKITVTPNSIIFNLVFEGGNAWRILYNANISQFFGPPYLSIQGLREFSLTDGTRPMGVPASSYELYTGPRKLSKPIKRKTHTVVFPFNSARMLFNIFNESYTRYDNSLVMDFVECSPKNPVKDWEPSCINFKQVFLPFTNKQLHLLNMQNYLNNTLIKKEFETSADFQKRTHPDTLLQGLRMKFDNFEQVFQDQLHQRFSQTTPSLVYNADRQEFTLQYPGLSLDPVVIHVPLAEAAVFKENFQRASQKIYPTKYCRRTESVFYIQKITFADQQKSRVFDNLYGKDECETWKHHYFLEVLKDLAKVFSKGKVWGELK